MIDERQLVLHYKTACDDVEILKQRLSEAKSKRDGLEQSLIDHLRSVDAKRTASYEGIGSVTAVKPRVYASCPQGRYDELFAWLDKQDRIDLVKKVVHASSLSRLIKANLEAGIAPPECVSYYFEESVRLNKA